MERPELIVEPPLVGRSEEVGLVVDCLGDHRAVVLAGAAGVGKTRVAAEVSRTLREQGWTPVVARVVASAAAVPLGPLAAVAALVETGADNLAIALANTRAGLAASGDRPVLVIDDAQLLDPASAAVVHLLVSEGEPVLLTVRTGVVAPDAIGALWKDGLAMRIDLQPMSTSEVGSMMTGMLGGPTDSATVALISSTAAGNPLFVRELVLAGRQSGKLESLAGAWTWRGEIGTTRRLASLLADRVGSLPDSVREVVELLAVAEPLAIDIIERATTSGALAAAERQGLVSATSDGLVHFGHPLYGEVIRDALGAVARRDAARRIVHAEELSPPLARSGDALVRVSLLRLEAGLDADPEVLVAAAHRAIALFDHDAAARLASAAVGAGGGAAAQFALGDAYYWLGRHEDALEVATRSTGGETLTDSERAQLTVLGASALFFGLGRADDAHLLLEVTATQMASQADAAELRAHAASLEQFAGDALRSLESSDAVLAGPVSARAAGRAHGTRAISLMLMGRHDEAIAEADAHLGDALALLDELPLAVGTLLIAKCAALGFAGRLDEMTADTTALLGLAIEEHADDLRGLWATLVGRSYMLRGDLEAADAFLRDASVYLALHDPGGARPWAHAVAVCVAALRGDSAEAQRQLAAAESARGATVVGLFDADLWAGRAWAAAVSGELSRAKGIARGAAGRFAAIGHGQATNELFLLRVRLGDVDAALIDGLAARADSGPMEAAAAAFARGILLDDVAMLDEARALYEAHGALLLAAECAARAASSYGVLGRRSSETRAAASARDLLSRCPGADPARVVAPPVGADVSFLTGREREVAGLAARGHSKREIAERLTISPSTVSNHLNHTYAKLGVSTREELAYVLGVPFP